MKPIILASSSPRRKRLLAQAGISFTVDPSDIPEVKLEHEDAETMVKRLARDKGREVAKRHKNSIVIAADTTVVCHGQILEKPQDAEDARRMLVLLNNTDHLVITGFTVIDINTNQEKVGSVTSKVYFKKLTDKQIEEYIKTGEAFDKAGAYAIQEGLSQAFVEKVEGDFDNAVGLPVDHILKIMKKLNALG